MARGKKWNPRSTGIVGEDGLEDLPPPRGLPPEPKIAGTREEAIERGRKLGEDEAYRRREIGEEAESRIARAMAYAAWEFDGKPTDGGYKNEFKIGGEPVVPSHDRATA